MSNVLVCSSCKWMFNCSDQCDKCGSSVYFPAQNVYESRNIPILFETQEKWHQQNWRYANV